MTDVPPDDTRTRFVLELAKALHVHGTPAHRLEAVLSTVARKVGLEADFFSTPTSIMVGIGQDTSQRVYLLRVHPGAPNLGHLSTLSTITRDVIEGTASPIEGWQRIRELLESPQRWPTWLQLLAFVFSSSAVASFLGLSAGDVFVAAILGMTTGLVAMFTSRHVGLVHVTEALAAFVVSTIAFVFDTFSGHGSGFLTSLAGLVVLLPGLTFTVAMTELSTRHLASGTARLSGALVVFLGLGFGLALGAELGGWIGAHLSTIDGVRAGPWMSALQLPAGIEWLAVVIAALSFTVLLNGDAHDAGWIVVACFVAYASSRFATAAMGDELAAFISAAVVTALSTLVARMRKKTSVVMSVPGLLILVPGSIGFRSVTSLIGDEVEAGVATAFNVALIGISLAAGIVAGSLVSAKGEQRDV